MPGIGIGIGPTIAEGGGGNVLGPELLTNGDFGAGSTGWSVSGADATHIATFSGGTLRYQSDTTSPVLNVSQGPIATIGKLYRVTVVCSSYTSGSVKVFDQSGGNVLVNGTGTFTGTLVASTTGFTIQRNSANVDLTLDSVSLREVLA